MTIFFCGDVHGDFQIVVDAVKRHRPVGVVLLGDLQARRPLEVELADILDQTEIWFIHGNHDTDSDQDYDNLFGSSLAERNFHGKVADIAGVKIAGLGGVFRGQIWMPPAQANYSSADEFIRRAGKGNLWRGGLVRKHHSSIFPEDYFKLLGQRADVLVTHEAPSFHVHGFGAIDDLASDLGAGKSFHGHHHERFDYRNQSQSRGVDAFGVGFREIMDLEGRYLVDGEFNDPVS